MDSDLIYYRANCGYWGPCNGNSIRELLKDWDSIDAVLMDIGGTIKPFDLFDENTAAQDVVLRNGTKDVIRLLSYQDRALGLNSDSHTSAYIEELSKILNAEQYVDLCAGRDFPGFISKSSTGNRPYRLKHYEALSHALNTTPDKTLVVADAGCDYESAEYFGMKYLQVPGLISEEDCVACQIFPKLNRLNKLYSMNLPLHSYSGQRPALDSHQY